MNPGVGEMSWLMDTHCPGRCGRYVSLELVDEWDCQGFRVAFPYAHDAQNGSRQFLYRWGSVPCQIINCILSGCM